MAHYFAAVSIQSKHGDTGHHGIATKWRALLMIQDEEDKMREEQKKKGVKDLTCGTHVMWRYCRLDFGSLLWG
jgi:hypothetical protein